jgi:hypothetical protein
MRFDAARPIILAMFAVASLSLTIQACDKDDAKDEAAVPTSTKSASAAKAAQGAIKIPAIGGTSLKEFGPELRSIYKQGMMQSKRFQKIQNETPDLSQFDICSLMTSSCEQMAATPLEEEGMTCTTTCPASGTTMSCTSPEQVNTCNGVQYTMNDMISNSTTSCTKSSATLYSFGINVDMTGKVKGGDITESTELSCKFSFAMAFDLQNPPSEESQEFDTAAMCNNMVCSIGGEPMSCQDMQEAMKEESCTE